jgi:cell volume regulation protein A
MSAHIIITICILLLIAYIFDLTSSKTRIPSVILLLLLGWGVKQITLLLGIPLPDLNPVLPGLGTVGLVLIVLEGSLELDLQRSKVSVITKSLFGALLPMIIVALGIALLFHLIGGFSFRTALLNSVPFSIISSAIAIPSVRALDSSLKEFVVYESSFSDILGVLFFNFILTNEIININSFGNFTLQILLMFVISLITTLGLSLFLSKVNHHIKFIPIILVILLVYTATHEFMLPSLIFIMIFGLFLGNIEKMDKYKWSSIFGPGELAKEINKFKEFVGEISFLIRALFFMLFGYLINTADLLNLSSLCWAIAILALITFIRAAQLKITSQPIKPLIFVAPRGLITILLVLSIPPALQIPVVDYPLMIQIIVLSSLIMMFGLMFNSKSKNI